MPDRLEQIGARLARQAAAHAEYGLGSLNGCPPPPDPDLAWAVAELATARQLLRSSVPHLRHGPGCPEPRARGWLDGALACGPGADPNTRCTCGVDPLYLQVKAFLGPVPPRRPA